MKIEITDRKYWIEQFEKEFNHICVVRAKRDLEYEKKWRKRWLLPDRGEDDFPPKSGGILGPYPSKYGWMRINEVIQIINSLKSSAIGDIYLTSEDLELIDWRG